MSDRRSAILDVRWLTGTFRAVFLATLTLPFTPLPAWLQVGAVAVLFGLQFAVNRVQRPPWIRHKCEPAPIVVRPPMIGTLRAAATPGARVPSHRTHAYAQTYAIDLVSAHSAPKVPLLSFAPPNDFDAFGMPVVAVADGEIVRARDRRRDHRARRSWFGWLYLLVEGPVRDVVGGADSLLGNYIVVALDIGTFALYAHVQRDSVKVHCGDRVRQGDVLAACGNSGNSSEPHLHFQLMTRPNWHQALGLPLAFLDGTLGERRSFVPQRDELVVGQPVTVITDRADVNQSDPSSP